MSDPLTTFTNELEKYLIASPAIRRVMKSNVERRVEAFVTTRGTKVNDVQIESDLPRIYILSQGGPSNVNLASNLATFDLTYEIGIRSGDKRFNHDLFPLAFALFAAVTSAVVDPASPLFALRWDSETVPLLRNLALSDMKYGFTSSTGDAAGITGTNAICALTAYLQFDQRKLVAFNSQT